MTKDEALKMALEALEAHADIGIKADKAITAIREALAQPETVSPGGGLVPAVPVAVYGYCPVCGGAGVMRERRPNGDDKCTNGHKYPSSKALAQPEQEPVAYTTGHCENHKQKGGCQLHNLQCGWPDCDRKPITTPPQRKPLSDVEIWNTYKNLWMFHPAEEPRLAGDVLKFARAIEAKLKEKNT